MALPALAAFRPHFPRPVHADLGQGLVLQKGRERRQEFVQHLRGAPILGMDQRSPQRGVHGFTRSAYTLEKSRSRATITCTCSPWFLTMVGGMLTVDSRIFSMIFSPLDAALP